MKRESTVSTTSSCPPSRTLARVRVLALALAVSLVVSLAWVAPAHAQGIRAGRLQHGTLAFDGHATVGNFTGTTTSVRGEHTAAERLAGVRGWVEGDVDSLRTGNGRRDRDLRSSMEADRFPTMRFELAGVAPDDPSVTVPAAGSEVGVILEGKLTLHGVTRDVRIPARLRFTAGGVEVHGGFPVNLKDYRIGGLTKVLGVLKMDEHIAVRLDLLFAT
jgi:polyisoprenoid-binding protein YceI